MQRSIVALAYCTGTHTVSYTPIALCLQDLLAVLDSTAEAQGGEAAAAALAAHTFNLTTKFELSMHLRPCLELICGNICPIRGGPYLKY
jgi:hypothetical protein